MPSAPATGAAYFFQSPRHARDTTGLSVRRQTHEVISTHMPREGHDDFKPMILNVTNIFQSTCLCLEHEDIIEDYIRLWDLFQSSCSAGTRQQVA